MVCIGDEDILNVEMVMEYLSSLQLWTSCQAHESIIHKQIHNQTYRLLSKGFDVHYSGLEISTKLLQRMVMWTKTCLENPSVCS